MSLFNSSFNHLRRQFDALAHSLLHDVGPLNPNRFRTGGKLFRNRKFASPLMTQSRSNQQGVGGGSNSSPSQSSSQDTQQQSSSSSSSQLTNPQQTQSPQSMSRRRFPRRRFYNDFDDDDDDNFLTPFSMTSPFNQFLSDLSNFYTPSTSMSSEVLPDIKVDVHKEKDKYVVKAEMPGIEKDAVNVDIENGFLTISGEKKLEKNEEDKNKKRIYSERSYGRFERSFQLPDDILQEKIDAKFENGVLTLDIHRQPEKIQQEQKKKITIS